MDEEYTIVSASGYNKPCLMYENVFPNEMYNVNYENFVNDFEQESKKLIFYLGINWDTNCLNFHESERYVNTASFAQVKRKIFKNSSSEWENYSPFLEKYFNKLNKD